VDAAEPSFVSEGATELRAGSSSWHRYAVIADVHAFPGRWITLAAACAGSRETLRCGGTIQLKALKGEPHTLITRVTEDGQKIRRPEVTRGGRLFAPINHRHSLLPDFASWWPRPRAQRDQERYQSRLERYRRKYPRIPTHQERWLRLRIEMTRSQLRLWLEGQLLASVDQPRRTQGGIMLSLPAGSRLRQARVDPLPAAVKGFLPLDLIPHFNGQALQGQLGDGYAFSAKKMPPAGTFISVGGVPFYWTAAPGRANSLDISRARFRGLRPYVSASADRPDVSRIIIRVPKKQYRTLAVIGAADTNPLSTNVLNVRMFKPGRGMVVDSTVPIPRWDAAASETTATALPAGHMLKGKSAARRLGRLWMTKIPLDPGAFQDFIASDREYFIELDFTGAAKDPGEPPTVERPVGVHLLAATLVESPVEMTVSSSEVGHIFMEPKIPTMRIKLRNTTAAKRAGRIEIRDTDFYQQSKSRSVGYLMEPWKETTVTVPVPVTKRGLHYLDVRLMDGGDELLVRRRTTFASLPRVNRLARQDSPFGMWVFSRSHYGAGERAAGELMHKIGVRWAHGVPLLSPAFTERYTIWPAYGVGLNRLETVHERARRLSLWKSIIYWPQFQERVISKKHLNSFPPELLERPRPRHLTADEERTFKKYWKRAVENSKLVRKHPQMKLVFGVSYPQIIAAFLSRGFPRKYIDFLALDFNGDKMQHYYYLRQIADHYGYKHIPFQILEGFYVGSDRGYYPDPALERQQSDTYIQGYLRGLALGVTRFGGSPEIWDPGSSFYWSSSGNVGLCHMPPELNPKPAYVAFGTMTQMLDRAKFHSAVPTGSVVTYALRFNREGNPDQPRRPVYALWSVRGSRMVSFQASPGSKPMLTDSQGNSQAVAVRGGRASIELGTEPQWLELAGEIYSFQAEQAHHGERPPVHARPLARLGDLDRWQVEKTSIPELQALDDSIPVAPAMFQLGRASGKDAGQKALALHLTNDPRLSPHRLRYARLRPVAPVIIPRHTANLGLWIRGNGAASVDLELEDAAGLRWTTILPRPRLSFGMDYRGPQAFDGWRYISFPLVNNGPRGPSSLPWRTKGAQGSPALPAKLTGVVLQQYAKVIYLSTLTSPSPKSWLLGDALLAEVMTRPGD